MTKLEKAIREVSDLRDFYLKIENHRKKSPTYAESSAGIEVPVV